MNVRHSVSMALLLTVVASVPAFAQEPQVQTSTPRFYVTALGGAVSRPPAGAVFGVEVAEHLGRHAQAYLTLSYFENLMGQPLRDGLDATAARLTALTADRWSFSGRDRGVSIVGGGKYVFGDGSFRPYVGGGAGMINLKRSIVEGRIGDVTRAVFNDFELGDADLSLNTNGVIKPVVEAAFGVGIGAGRAHLDIGYRYRTAFRLSDTLDFSQVTAGIGYRF